MKYWHAINQFYNLNLVIKNDVYDPTFSFMHADHDGKLEWIARRNMQWLV